MRHPQFPKVAGIPETHLKEVCLLGQTGACACLDFSTSEQVRICSKGRGRNLPAGVTATGGQYHVCSGPPDYSVGVEPPP